MRGALASVGKPAPMTKVVQILEAFLQNIWNVLRFYTEARQSHEGVLRLSCNTNDYVRNNATTHRTTEICYFAGRKTGSREVCSTGAR